MQTGATTPNIVAPTMLGVVACVLAVVTEQTDATTPNKFWDLQCIVGRIQPISLCLCNPCVMSVRGHNNVGRAKQTDPTPMRNERAWPQQCWKSYANGSNIVELRFGDHGTKEMLGVVD